MATDMIADLRKAECAPKTLEIVVGYRAVEGASLASAATRSATLA
jgi:hypothetical protein